MTTSNRFPEQGGTFVSGTATITLSPEAARLLNAVLERNEVEQRRVDKRALRASRARYEVWYQDVRSGVAKPMPERANCRFVTRDGAERTAARFNRHADMQNSGFRFWVQDIS